MYWPHFCLLAIQRCHLVFYRGKEIELNLVSDSLFARVLIVGSGCFSRSTTRPFWTSLLALEGLKSRSRTPHNQTSISSAQISFHGHHQTNSPTRQANPKSKKQKKTHNTSLEKRDRRRKSLLVLVTFSSLDQLEVRRREEVTTAQCGQNRGGKNTGQRPALSSRASFTRA